MTTASADRRHRWLVTGGSGLLGGALCAYLRASGHDVVAVRRDQPVPEGVAELVTDLASDFDAEGLLAAAGAGRVVHAAGLTDVDACEVNEQVAHRLHVDAAQALARAAAVHGARYVLISTDQLWGELRGMASEQDVPSPVNAYGRTKAAGERASLASYPRSLVVRTNFFGVGSRWRPSLSELIRERIQAGGTYHGFTDVRFTPIGLPLLVRAIVELVDSGISGVVHIGGGERVSKFTFARRVAAHLGLAADRVEPGSLAAAALAAPRPHEMSLDSVRAERILGRRMPVVSESLHAVYGPARAAWPVHGGR